MKKRVYTEEFRREAVRLLRTSGKSARQVADELGMPQSVLSRWKCTADNAQKTAGRNPEHGRRGTPTPARK